jgi:hypothetical protein
MRGAVLLLLAATLASCTNAPPPGWYEARNQQELARLLAGKTAGPPISCLPSYNSNDMQIIDGRNVAFKLGSRTVYMMHLSPGCELLGGGGGYALLTHQFGGMGMCEGDIARVIDTTSRTTVGSCGIERIVPFTGPGGRRY